MIIRKEFKVRYGKTSLDDCQDWALDRIMNEVNVWIRDQFIEILSVQEQTVPFTSHDLKTREYEIQIIIFGRKYR